MNDPDRPASHAGRPSNGLLTFHLTCGYMVKRTFEGVMNIFHEKFSTGQVVDATGVPNETLQNWMKRDLIIGHKGIEGGGGKGRTRQFSFHSLMAIAVAGEFVSVGGMADLKDIFRAADHFAHAGEGLLPSKPGRIPGLPFRVKNSKTLIVAGRGWSDEIFFTLEDRAIDLFASLGQQGGAWIDASDLFDRTLRNLGHDPAAVMKFAYGRGD